MLPQQPPQQAQAPQPTAVGTPPQMAPQHVGKESGRMGQQYNPQVLNHIEQHLASLPDPQKGFLVQYMTPELAIILGIVIGNEAYDYFKQYADPQKMLVVQPRPEQSQGQQNSAPQAAPQGQPPVQQSAQSVQPQPKATAPAKSIMGV